MGELVGFPGARVAAPSIAQLKCEECGGAPMIFVPIAPLVHAYCSPTCAAACGIAPWASADLVDRSGWRSRAEMEAQAQ